MSRLSKVLFLGGAALLPALAALAWHWRGLPAPGLASRATAPADDHPDHDLRECVELTPQGRANLRLTVAPIRLQSYTRSIVVPGLVTEHQGKSEHGVVAPLAGVVQRVAAYQGMTLRPGDELFTLRVVSESVQRSQTELFRASRELQIIHEQRARLEKAGSAIPEARLLDLDNQQRRQQATVAALRFELSLRGFTKEQIAGALDGKFVTEIVVRAPEHADQGPLASAAAAGVSHGAGLEIEELKVHLGQHVQAGQLLCALANHQLLYIEGRAFRQELELVERAARERWPVEADFVEADSAAWPPLGDKLTIRFLGHRIDTASQTVPFYLVLPNTCREQQQAGRTYRTWRFYPGQRVRLRVPVEEFRGVYVLPAAALVREGPETFVFRANGAVFDRIAVHVRHEDPFNAVIANDGSINEGNHLAQNAAASLNRILKAQTAAGGHAHHHDH